jgi:hypothetical protein
MKPAQGWGTEFSENEAREVSLVSEPEFSGNEAREV